MIKLQIASDKEKERGKKIKKCLDLFGEEQKRERRERERETETVTETERGEEKWQTKMKKKKSAIGPVVLPLYFSVTGLFCVPNYSVKL